MSTWWRERAKQPVAVAHTSDSASNLTSAVETHLALALRDHAGRHQVISLMTRLRGE